MIKQDFRLGRFNIDNAKARLVRFTGTRLPFFPKDLTHNNVYNVERVEVGRGSTRVFLKEFPGLEINSVLLREVEYDFQINGRDVIFVQDLEISNLPIVCLADKYALDLSEYASQLQSLKCGESFSVGRDTSCNLIITNNDSLTSRQHCFVVKDEFSNLSLYSSSLNGIKILIGFKSTTYEYNGVLLVRPLAVKINEDKSIK